MGAVKSRSYGSYRIHNNDLDNDKDCWSDGADGYERPIMAKPQVRVCKSEEEIARFLGFLIEKKANEAIRRADKFRVGVSGGSLPNFLCQALPSITTDWSKWLVFFCDERLVSFTDPDSTYHVYRERLLNTISLQDDQIVKINPSLTAVAAASDYAGKIAQYFPDEELPRFDVLLLGMGPDGHTCSLFPNHSLLQEQGLWVASLTDSPKPPPSRITLTLPVLNNASCVIFISTGASKAETVKDVLENPSSSLPSALVHPHHGDLHWILDQAAASNLSNV